MNPNSFEAISDIRRRFKFFLYDYSILFPFLVVLVLMIPCIFFEDARAKEYLLGAIGIGGGLSYFLLTHHTEEVKLFKELFESFNLRYDQINEELNQLRKRDQSRDFTKEENDLLYNYFNLCGEEYLYFKKGFIYPEVWEAWLKGMRIFYRVEKIKLLWNEELKTGSYYGLTPTILRGDELPACCSENGSSAGCG